MQDKRQTWGVWTDTSERSAAAAEDLATAAPEQYILRIPEQARGLYYQGESMRALQLLSQVRFKSPKNPYWLAVLSIETMCRHDVGDSAGESLALSRLDELGRKASAGSPLAKELDKLRARYRVILKDPAAWTSQDAAFIRDGIDRAQSPLEYAS